MSPRSMLAAMLRVQCGVPAIAIVFVLLTSTVLAAAQAPNSKLPANAESAVVRGKYLVEGVARCGQCHTPRDGDKNYERAHWLQGAAVPWLPATKATTGPGRAPLMSATGTVVAESDPAPTLIPP